MVAYQDRQQTIEQRIEALKKQVQDLKSVQLFGGDVSRPKVIERNASWDIEGVVATDNAFVKAWGITATIRFIPDQQEEPYFEVYAETDTGWNLDEPEGRTWTTSLDYTELLNGEIVYTFTAGVTIIKADPPTGVDHIYAKLYIHATDTGIMDIDVTQGILL